MANSNRYYSDLNEALRLFTRGMDYIRVKRRIHSPLIVSVIKSSFLSNMRAAIYEQEFIYDCMLRNQNNATEDENPTLL